MEAGLQTPASVVHLGIAPESMAAAVAAAEATCEPGASTKTRFWKRNRFLNEAALALAADQTNWGFPQGTPLL